MDLREMKRAGEILKKGGLVAFPTETVYGLGGDALDETAAHRIYEAKGRPSDNPLIAHISCLEELKPLVAYIPEAGRKLAEAYWPGPLTMVFPKSDIVPYGTTGGLDTVAVRMPNHPVALELIRRFIDPMEGGMSGQGWQIGELPSPLQLTAFLRTGMDGVSISRMLVTAWENGQERPVDSEFYEKHKNPFRMAVNGEHMVYIEVREC